MPKIWKICSQDPKQQVKLSNALGVHPIVAQLLINREITDLKEAKDFFSADLSTMHDPLLLKNMDKAVKRIARAGAKGEKILIVGDYDVDGITSSVLLNKILRQLGIRVAHYIPHRMNDGYGLNEHVSRIAVNEGAGLVIAVDCGITAHHAVDLVNRQNVDVIVIDHHEPNAAELPAAFAIINPKQRDCPYPFKHLASVGLVTKLAQAMLGRESSEHVLDLAAIGTVADVVPLRGENRVLVKSGLPKISATKNKGLMALLELTKIKDKKLTPFHIGFVIGPRINAAGRMDSAQTSLDLFLSEDSQEAYELARALDKHNVQRQAMQRNIIEEALALAEQEINFKEQKVIVLQKEGWHRGVLGIVASHLTEKYYRPSIVISVDNGIGTASARSIDGFHLHEALASCAEYLEEFGGHAGAAGLTIKAENIDPFRALINQVAHETLELKKLMPTLVIDGEIPLSMVNLELAEIIDAMAPFGEGNPAPVFCSRQVTVKSRPALLGKNTLKFWVCDNDYAISAVGFGMGEYQGIISAGQKIDLAYEISIDDWNKSPVPQLKLKDIRLSEG
ncbi:MAG: single-stranded-DNA-specific exonuclease RecJ [Omnitrophica WOR_2 bacterium RIFCSPHIGHO2_02_FULL_52_10]|nr:MAG: single-stranded-DNA-specific exonuclease RecJ [Omnitrophica WOR_2 bacterium RIFCSPHIGHO2_02_FULL_52_10]